MLTGHGIVPLPSGGVGRLFFLQAAGRILGKFCKAPFVTVQSVRQNRLGEGGCRIAVVGINGRTCGVYNSATGRRLSSNPSFSTFSNFFAQS